MTCTLAARSRSGRRSGGGAADLAGGLGDLPRCLLAGLADVVFRGGAWACRSSLLIRRSDLAEAEDGRERFVDAPLLFRTYPAD
jgi:hypothetical protein